MFVLNQRLTVFVRSLEFDFHKRKVSIVFILFLLSMSARLILILMRELKVAQVNVVRFVVSILQRLVNLNSGWFAFGLSNNLWR